MKNDVTFEELFNQSIKDVKLEKTVTGKIIEITKKGEIFVDLGYKSDGIIPKEEYSFDEKQDPKKEFKIGDTITADVIKQNDGMGNVLLSYKRVKYRKNRQEFENKIESEEIFKEKILEATDKGFIVNYKEIRIFIPISLSGIMKNEDPYKYKDKEIEFKIIQYEPKQRRIIGSAKKVLEDRQKQKEENFWEDIEIGKEYEGNVKNITNYGAFIDIGGVQGLLHVSEISWNKNTNINEILKVNQNIKVQIKELDKESKKIKLSYPEKGENPWNNITDKYNINDIIKVKVVKFMPFGAFVKIEDGIEGLVHISQISDKKITKPEDILKIGQHVNAKIIDINQENNKMELSIKELEGTSNEYIEEI
ncbi:MAG: S1 RNA-binding domain-containing protein [Clostridia bacterium]|jgi:ribosomal protein S1|nr:S1 RNA-binding domain-containing protein [Clostridia bacterium]